MKTQHTHYYSVLIVMGLLLNSFSSFATNYYLSVSGNNASAGTSAASAWASILRLNMVTSSLQPGDSVLFRRGDTFNGQISLTSSGSNANKIVFGAYGNINLPIPIISGGRQLSGWSLLSGNKYKVAMGSTPVYFLFANDNIQTLA